MSGSLEESVEATMRRVEAELKRMIAVMNDQVVPGLRRDGGKMLLKLSEELRKLGESLER